jgi:hypothetical protein
MERRSNDHEIREDFYYFGRDRCYLGNASTNNMNDQLKFNDQQNQSRQHFEMDVQK